MRLHATEERDLDYVLELEADPDASAFIIPWSRQRHRQALTDPDEDHLLVLDEERPLGFVLLSGLGDPNYGVELRRIVIERRGGGLGRRAIEMVLDRAFAEHGAHRVWLDVMLPNGRARRAYEAVGFVEEGVLRDALVTDSGYQSLALMSVLRDEWGARRGV